MSSISDVPGPNLASISRLWHLRGILAGDQNLRFTSAHDKYGTFLQWPHSFLSFWLASVHLTKPAGHFVRIAPDEVSVSHPEAIKKILLTPLPKANWYKLLAIPDYRFQTPMSTTDPKEKIARSKNFSSGWALTNILQNESAIDRVMEQFFDWVDKFAEEKKSMELNQWFSFAAFDTAGEAIFSKQFGFLREGRDIGNSVANGGALNAYVAIMGFFRWVHVGFLGNPFMTALKVLPMGHLFDTSVQAVEERLTNQDSRFDILAHWLRSLERNSGSMTMRDIYAMATGAIGAGSDTITCGLQSFFYHTIRHPDVWAKLCAEIDKARENGLCEGPTVSFADAQTLTYLQACIKESMRVFAPVPMTLPRKAPKEGITIGDRYFPAGTTISVNPWVIHHSKELWGLDAREFIPERWFREDISQKERYFIPFGAGYNSCPGQNLAKVELSKITATLIRDYNIHQVEPSRQLEYSAYFIMVPHWTPCYVEKRSPKSGS
ncbi:cytochrome P450, partial [Xylariales sp. PMI_506]